jgi:hypothetical protein
VASESFKKQIISKNCYLNKLRSQQVTFSTTLGGSGSWLIQAILFVIFSFTTSAFNSRNLVGSFFSDKENELIIIIIYFFLLFFFLRQVIFLIINVDE